MYKYEFYGRIIPKRINFNFKDDKLITFNNKNPDVKGKFTFESENSNAKIVIVSENNYSANILTWIKIHICEEYGRLILDYYSYLRSSNFELYIEGVRCKEANFDKKFYDHLEQDIKPAASEIGSKIDRILSMISSGNNIIKMVDVFGDFRRAIKYQKSSGFYFYRCVEIIRSLFFEDKNIKDDKKRAKDGFDEMNNAFSINETYYTDLLKFSKPNRHGQYPPISLGERVKLAKDTRFIIEKAIDLIEK